LAVPGFTDLAILPPAQAAYRHPIENPRPGWL
jgi:hypothetical protein